jgi:hypothetical protein
MILAMALVLAAPSPVEPSSDKTRYVIACVHATLKSNGRTEDVSIAETSGFKNTDREAVRLVHVYSVKRERKVTYYPQTGYVRVQFGSDGSLGIDSNSDGSLLSSCSAPVVRG